MNNTLKKDLIDSAIVGVFVGTTGVIGMLVLSHTGVIDNAHGDFGTAVIWGCLVAIFWAQSFAMRRIFKGN